jgi:hypothetical protein
MYIAVNPGAIAAHPGPNDPRTLAEQENKMLDAIFAPDPRPAGLFFESDDRADQGMALLSILAHELGHLLLAETNADGTGDPANGHVHERSTLCDTQQQRPNSETCFDDDFLALWNAATFHRHMRRWIGFGDVRNRPNRYLSGAHELSTVLPSPPRPANPDAAAALLDNEFASLYAAVSPEEDLVETYKYMILADVAQNSHLRLNIPQSPVYVLDKVSGATAGTNLKRKIDCVKRLKPALN